MALNLEEIKRWLYLILIAYINQDRALKHYDVSSHTPEKHLI